MRKWTTYTLTVLSVTCFMLPINGCSIFISTPRTATIHIQGLDNKPFDYVIALDEPVAETNLDIRLSNSYTLQLDFDWIWNSGDENIMEFNLSDKDIGPNLVPWMSCKYRF